MAIASLSSLVYSALSSKESKQLSPNDFLPFKLGEPDSEEQQLKNSLSPSTARLVLSLLERKVLPPHVEKMIKGTSVWSILLAHKVN